VESRFRYRVLISLISVFVLSWVSFGGSPATAAPSPAGPAPAPAVSPGTGARPDPVSGPRPGPGATSRPKAAPKGDGTPRRANVRPGARPPAGSGKAAKRSGTAAAGCGGVVTFGKIETCSTLAGKRQDVFTVTTTVDNDVLYGTLTQTDNGDTGDTASATVWDADSNYLCYFVFYPGTCELGAAGTYTVRVSLYSGTGDVAYTFSAQSLKTPAACRTLDEAFFSFGSAGLASEIPLGSAGECYNFDQPVGSVLHTYSPGSTADVRGGIVDAEYQPVCPVQDDTTCTLSTAGPYRLMMYEFYGNAATYTLRMSRISHSTGCPVLRPASFGDPGAAAGTGTLGGQYSVACHKLRSPAAGGVAIRIHNGQTWWNVYDDAGRRICDKFDSAWSCQLPAEGDYTILVSNQNWDPVTYQIAVTALYGSAGCSAGTSLAWDQNAALLHQTSALQTNCQEFHGAAGQRVVTYVAPTSYNDVYATLVDGTGRALCRDYGEETGCLLPADGTYRVVTYLSSWGPETTDATYKVQVRSLSAPSGCPVVSPGAYNALPAGGLAPIRCRVLRISEAGVYRIRAFDDENNRTYAAVYDVTGHRICDDSGYCEIPAAGDYTLVLDGQATRSVIDNDFAYVTSVLPRVASGCPPVTQELYRAAFTAPGQYLCVQLPQSAGQRIVELVPSGARYPVTYVTDSAGDQLCDSSYELWQTSCELTGPGPYSAVLSQPEGVAPAARPVRFVRVDGPPACPVFDGAAVTTSADDFAVCRSIPAGGHGTRETFSWSRSSGTGGAYLSIFDANGIRYCGPTGTFESRTVTCTLPDGQLTVILHAAAADAVYHLDRRPA
jgi:hypothetical protein